jgi:HEAT repeat protein
MDEKPEARADKLIVRGIAAIQLLFCLLGLAMMPFAFMYGGAAVWPTRFQNSIGFLLFGVATALYLFSRHSLARLLAAIWYGFLIGLIVFRLNPQQMAKSGTVQSLLVWSALAAFYLSITSLGSLWRETKKNPAAAGYAFLSILLFAEVVACFAYLTRETVGGLERQLHSSNGDERCVASRRLATKGAEAKVALPAWKAMLDNTLCVDFGEFADDPASDIEKIGGIDPLIDVMKNGGSLGRSAAAWHLRRVAAKYPERVDDLKAAFAAGLKDKDGLVRQASIEGIGALGARAADLLPELAKMANDPSEQVRDLVVDATANTGSLESLRALLANPDKQIRSRTIQALGYGPFGDAAIPALESALNDPVSDNSQQAATELSKFGRRALSAVPSLERAARSSPSQATRNAAIATLGGIGPEAYPCITGLLNDSDPAVAEYAGKWKISLEARYPNLRRPR